MASRYITTEPLRSAVKAKPILCLIGIHRWETLKETRDPQFPTVYHIAECCLRCPKTRTRDEDDWNLMRGI
jgi:hypothetical protein